MMKDRLRYAWRRSRNSFLAFLLSIPTSCVVLFVVWGLAYLSEGFLLWYFFLFGAILAVPIIIIFYFLRFIIVLIVAYLEWNGPSTKNSLE